MEDIDRSETTSTASQSVAAFTQIERAALAARNGIHSDFVKVPQLAKMLGISAVSIHSQMRRGTFPMPHRRVGNVLMVKFDDYASWYLADGQPPSGVTERNEAADEVLTAADIDVALGRESPAERKERFKREVLAGMGRKRAKP